MDLKNRVCIGCEGIDWSLHRLRWIGQRISDTTDRGDAADFDNGGFKDVSRIDQSTFMRIAMMEIKLSDRQFYLLIRIFYVISLEIYLGKSLP